VSPRVSAVDAGRDIGHYLGLVGRWAWVLFGLYAAVYIAVAIVQGVPGAGVPVSIGSLVLVLGAALLIASPSRTPLPIGRVLLISVLCVAAVLVMLMDLPTGLGYRSLVTWQLGAVNFILFVLELRGRIVTAWLLTIVITAVVTGWSLLATGQVWTGLQLTYGQAVSLAAGTVFAIGLQRTARQIFAQQDAERVRAAEEVARRVGDAHRAAELAEVRALAGPILQRIAAGDDVDRRDAVVLEAALRDRIRGRALATEPLTSALRRARDRDVDVLLLDDLGDVTLTPERAALVAAWCAERVDALEGARVTIRLAAGPDGALVSIANADGIVGELAVGLDVPVDEGSSSSARRMGRTGRSS
jgi:hypothetical protein